MDVHVYKDGKHIVSHRNIKEGAIINVEGDPRDYEIITEKSQELPPTRWPEGAEL